MKLTSILVIAILIGSSFTLFLNFSDFDNTVSGSPLYVGSNSTYKTIQDAVDFAVSGDVIIVKPDVYIENVVIDTDNITLRGNNSITTVLIGNSVAAFKVNADLVTIEFFNITTSTNSVDGIQIDNANNCTLKDNNINTRRDSGADGIRINTGHHATVMNNTITITGESSYGINIEYVTRSKFINNTIYADNTFGHGLYTSKTDNNSYMDNNITVLGSSAAGFVAWPRCNDNFIHNNTITAINASADTMSLYGLLGNTISDNKLLATSANAYGMRIVNNLAPVVYPKNNRVLNNTILGKGNNCHAIELNYGQNNTIYNNTINVTGSSSSGIHFNAYCYENMLKLNNITLLGPSGSCNGITLALDSAENNITNNDIHVRAKTSSRGIHLNHVNDNNVTDNNVTVYFQTGSPHNYGIYVLNSAYDNIIDNNTVVTRGSYGMGIYLTSSAYSNSILNNRISTWDSWSRGVYVYNEGSDHNFIDHNTITTNGVSSDGIWVYTSTNFIEGMKINNNTINADGTYARGIHLYRVNQTTIEGNNVTTLGSLSPGILLERYSNDITLTDNIISTTSSNCHGLNLTDATDITADNLTVETSQSNAAALQAKNSNATISNSSLNATNGDDIRLHYNSNITLINSTFQTTDASHSYGGKLWILNYLDILVYQNDTITPMENSGILILDNNVPIYNSTIYSGSDADTDSSGTIPTQLVVDRWYAFSDTPIENVTTVKVKKTIDKLWEEVRDVDMSSSHTEVFISADITAPSMPTGLTLEQVPGKSEINVSWTANSDDTATYSVYTNRSGSWVILQNVSHPDTLYTDSFPFVHGVRYYYRISAWDEVPIQSIKSSVKYIDFIDSKSPPTPTELSGEPIFGGDAINITWTLNGGTDTVSYVLYTNKTGDWVEIKTITHPTDYYIDSDGLVHGRTYYYKISARDNVPNESPPSNAIPVVHSDYLAPLTPTGLNVTSVIKGDAIKVSWHPNSDDTESYSIYSNRSGSWEKIDSVTHPVTNFIDNTDLIHGVRYYYRISASDEVPNESDLSAIVDTVHEDQLEPGPPTGLKAMNSTGNSIELSWDPNSEPDLHGYIIYMNATGEGSNGLFTNITTVTRDATKYIVTNLTEEVEYHFKLKAFDEVPLLSEFSIVASNKTRDATPPPIPIIEPLPHFTNVSTLVVHGNTEPNATIKLKRDGVLSKEDMADENGDFTIEITIVEGSNIITAYAVDKSGNPSLDSEAQTVVLDTVSPISIPGKDIKTEMGDTVTFNGSKSIDRESGVMNYTWRFMYNNRTVKLYGAVAEYIFEIIGIYEIILRVTDFAGNWHEDSLSVNITEIGVIRPKIKNTDPENNEENVAVDSPVTITFSKSMNKTRLESVLEILPEIEYILNWTSEDKVLRIDFLIFLEYNTTYNVSIGEAWSVEGITLQNAPYVLSFTTSLKPIIPPDTTPPEINLTKFVNQNKRLPVERQISIPFDEPLNESSINVNVTDSSGNPVSGDFAYDEGTYSVVFTPDEAFDYDEEYTVIIYAEDTSGNPIDPDKDTFTFTTEKEEEAQVIPPTLIWLMFIVIIIVIILIAVILILLRKQRKSEEEGEEEGERAEEEEESEDREEDLEDEPSDKSKEETDELEDDEDIIASFEE